MTRFIKLLPFRLLIILTMGVFSAPLWAVDPLGSHLAVEKIPSRLRQFRALQVNRFERNGAYRFGLGATWNPDLYAKTFSRFVADVGLLAFTGSSQDSSLHSQSALLSLHISLLYEYRFSETCSLEIGPGLSYWTSSGGNISLENPYRRDFRGSKFTLRLQDRLEPALGGIFDRWVLGFSHEAMGDDVESNHIEIGAGLRF